MIHPGENNMNLWLALNSLLCLIYIAYQIFECLEKYFNHNIQDNIILS